MVYSKTKHNTIQNLWFISSLTVNSAILYNFFLSQPVGLTEIEVLIEDVFSFSIGFQTPWWIQGEMIDLLQSLVNFVTHPC